MKRLFSTVVAAVLILGFIIYQKPEVRSWVDVNLLTLSTKEKQRKYLKLAHDYAHSLGVPGNLFRYEQHLRMAEDMAEKIIFLDGAEVEIGYQFEELTRDLEEELQGEIEAQSEARIQNRKMFEYLVKNYQFTSADIEKHKAILDEHMELVQEMSAKIQDQAKLKKITGDINEARKFQKAGLNIEAYSVIDRVKNTLYSDLSSISF